MWQAYSSRDGQDKVSLNVFEWKLQQRKKGARNITVINSGIILVGFTIETGNT
jgi:hypothetical protein